MKEKIQNLIAEVKNFSVSTAEELEQFRIYYQGRKGILTGLFEEFKGVPNEQKKETGKILNDLKMAIQARIDAFMLEAGAKEETVSSGLDLTRPVTYMEPGPRHPLSLVRNQIIEIFSRIGYTVAENREIEDDWHNFSALNFPEEHPARDMQDTFFIEKNPDIALRTHTSSVQIRTMEKNPPPIRSIFPGRVFRNEVISARAHCIFHQVEGLYVDRNVTVGDLKGTVEFVFRELMGGDVKIRFRPHYFSYTEPSYEIDFTNALVKKMGKDWLEIAGCGMVHPQVFETVGYDPGVWTGWAFGFGIERIAMIRYGINDIRLFYENDVRFLKQF